VARLLDDTAASTRRTPARPASTGSAPPARGWTARVGAFRLVTMGIELGADGLLGAPV